MPGQPFVVTQTPSGTYQIAFITTSFARRVTAVKRATS